MSLAGHFIWTAAVLAHLDLSTRSTFSDYECEQIRCVYLPTQAMCRRILNRWNPWNVSLCGIQSVVTLVIHVFVL